MSDLTWSSSGGGKKNRTMKCPICKQEITVYVDRSVERHKVFALDRFGKRNPNNWAWCTQKKIKE